MCKIKISNRNVKNCFGVVKKDVTECEKEVSTKELIDMMDFGSGKPFYLCGKYSDDYKRTMRHVVKFFGKTPEEMQLSYSHGCIEYSHSDVTFFTVKITKITEGVLINVLSYRIS